MKLSCLEKKELTYKDIERVSLLGNKPQREWARKAFAQISAADYWLNNILVIPQEVLIFPSDGMPFDFPGTLKGDFVDGF